MFLNDILFHWYSILYSCLDMLLNEPIFLSDWFHWWLNLCTYLCTWIEVSSIPLICLDLTYNAPIDFHYAQGHSLRLSLFDELVINIASGGIFLHLQHWWYDSALSSIKVCFQLEWCLEVHPKTEKRLQLDWTKTTKDQTSRLGLSLLRFQDCKKTGYGGPVLLVKTGLL